ncbi:MAG: signal peptidase I [Acidimicrobiales bacterium]
MYPSLPSAALDVTGPAVEVPRTPRPVTAVPIPVPEAPVIARRSARWMVEWAIVLAVAVVLAVGVRTFVVQMYYIPSGSMLPTLQIGDRIVVDKLSYRVHDVARGDIVVFRRPPLEHADYADLVKRVIGLPGETVSSADGRVYIDGRPLAEPWLPKPAPETLPSPLPLPFSLNHPYTVPAGEYFVMGDNRTDSEDSRYFGPIPGNLIVGKMAFTIWPLDDTGWLVVLSVVAGVLIVLIAAVLLESGSVGRAGDPSPGTPAVTDGG